MNQRRSAVLVLALAALLLAGCGGSSSTSTSTTASSPATTTATTTPATTTQQTAGRPGPEGVPLEQGPELAPASSTTPGTAVDGIQCAPVEQLAYHIHAHLQVYVDGAPRSLPGAIGILGPVAQQTPDGPFYGGSNCYYWLHTHASDGVIHIESPTVRIYTLGAFFDEWAQPLSADQVAGAKGPVTAFVNGKHWTRNPRAIPLVPHAAVQLDVGTPVVPAQTFSFAGTTL